MGYSNSPGVLEYFGPRTSSLHKTLATHTRAIQKSTEIEVYWNSYSHFGCIFPIKKLLISAPARSFVLIVQGRFSPDPFFNDDRIFFELALIMLLYQLTSHDNVQVECIN
jgi:hypothetical protein